MKDMKKNQSTDRFGRPVEADAQKTKKVETPTKGPTGDWSSDKSVDVTKAKAKDEKKP